MPCPRRPDTGVNTLTGEGLTEALAGADVVVDVSNSPSFEDAAVLEFFETSTRNILDAEAAAGVGHHVALSVVGTERLAESGYMQGEDRAREADQELVDPLHHRPRHAVLRVRHSYRRRGERRRHGAGPSGADPTDGRRRRRRRSVRRRARAPLNDTIELGGPEPLRFEDFVRQGLLAVGDQRVVVADPQARYFGAQLSERTLSRVMTPPRRDPIRPLAPLS